MVLPRLRIQDGTRHPLKTLLQCHIVKLDSPTRTRRTQVKVHQLKPRNSQIWLQAMRRTMQMFPSRNRSQLQSQNLRLQSKGGEKRLASWQAMQSLQFRLNQPTVGGARGPDT